MINITFIINRFNLELLLLLLFKKIGLIDGSLKWLLK